MPENIKKGTFINFIAYTLSGLFLFLFKIIAARGLGPAKFGIISVFWASILVTARFLTTGIKDGATRYISHYEAVNDKEGMTKTFLAHLKFMILITLFFLFVSLLLFRIITDNLFFGYVSLYILFIISCILYFSLLFLRGSLQGLRELKDNAISIIVEYSVMVLSLIIFFSFVKDVRLAGLSILLAPFSSLLFILSTARKHKKRFSVEPSLHPKTKTLLFFVIPTSFINFSSGFITQLGPLFIKFLGNFSLAGIFTVSLDIFKAARTALTALFISIFPHLSRQVALKNRKILNRMIREGLIFVLLAFIILIIVSLTIGQTIIRIIFGEEFVLDKIHLFLMSLFTGFFLLSELFNRVLLAKSMIKELTISWLIAFGFLFILLFFIPLGPLFRVELAFLGAGVVAFIGMSIFLIKRNIPIKMQK